MCDTGRPRWWRACHCVRPAREGTVCNACSVAPGRPELHYSRLPFPLHGAIPTPTCCLLQHATLEYWIYQGIRPGCEQWYDVHALPRPLCALSWLGWLLVLFCWSCLGVPVSCRCSGICCVPPVFEGACLEHGRACARCVCWRSWLALYPICVCASLRWLVCDDGWLPLWLRPLEIPGLPWSRSPYPAANSIRHRVWACVHFACGCAAETPYSVPAMLVPRVPALCVAAAGRQLPYGCDYV